MLRRMKTYRCADRRAITRSTWRRYWRASGGRAGILPGWRALPACVGAANGAPDGATAFELQGQPASGRTRFATLRSSCARSAWAIEGLAQRSQHDRASAYTAGRRKQHHISGGWWRLSAGLEGVADLRRRISCGGVGTGAIKTRRSWVLASERYICWHRRRYWRTAAPLAPPQPVSYGE